MYSDAVYEQLDQAVEQILTGHAIAPEDFDPLVEELLPIARDLQLTARPEFRSSLLAELERPIAAKRVPVRRTSPDAPLFRMPHELYPVHSTNFVVSAILHAAIVALIFTSGFWMVRHAAEVKVQKIELLTDLSPYVLPAAPTRTSGGGGGGDRDKIAASKGEAPRFALEQITPPAIVVRNNAPKLAVEPTVVGPPNLTKLGNLGDPLSGILTSSNGAGASAGIGSGSGGGIGSGLGAGVGPGYGGGLGGGIYRVGNGISAPHAIYDPEPLYSEEARKSKMEGVVALWLIVGADGRPHDVRVQRSLGMGLDEKAIEAVRTWKFQPAMKDGRPVAVQVTVEVNFRMF